MRSLKNKSRGRPLGRPYGSRSCLDPAKVEDIKAKLKAGQPVTEIARFYGTTRQAVSELAKRYGFPVRLLRRYHPLT